LFSNLERLSKIINNEEKPVQLFLPGKHILMTKQGRR